MSSPGNPNVNLAPNPAPLPYELQLANIQRQQRLADLLRQQSGQDIPVQTGGGQPAPISWGSVLAKALSGVGAGLGEKRALDQEKQLSEQDRTAAQQLVDALTRKTNQVGAPDMAPSTTQVDATAPQLPNGPAPAAGPAAPVQIPGQQGTGSQQAAPDPQAQIAALLSAQGGPQTRMIQQAMLPQVMNRQNMLFENDLNRQNTLWKNQLPLSEAEKQQIAAQGTQQQQNAQFQNQLPMTAAQRAQVGLGYAQLNKPEVVGPMSNVFYPKTGKFVEGPSMFGAAPGPVDPTSHSLTAQTGLSQAALDYLTSDIRPRGNQMTMIQNEITQWSKDHNIDTSTLRSQAKAANNTLQQNVTRNNQGTILENEIQGSIQNLAPLANAMGQGRINIANLANVWAGKQVSDPVVQQYRDQLLRLRQELAGYNAVAGGKLLENGQPRPDHDDLVAAEQVISSGINAGGLGGLAASITNSTAKNRAVLSNSVDDARQQVWSLFGVGKNYNRSSAPAPGTASPGGKSPPPGTTETKVLNGVTYYKINGQWHQ